MSAAHTLTPLRRFDVVVIGSGPAGGVVAAHAARAGASVLVIEAGSPISQRSPWFSHDAMLSGLSSGGVLPAGRKNPLAIGLPRVLGGGFAVNSGLYRWPSVERLGSWKQAGVDLTALETARVAVEAQLALHHGVDTSQCASALASTAGSLGLTTHTVSTWNIKGVNPCGPFIAEAVSLGVETITGVEVERIVAANGDFIVDLRGDHSNVYADRVVLTAGALGSPEVLIRSGMLDAGYKVAASPMLRSVLFPTSAVSQEVNLATVGRVQVEHRGFVLSGCGTAEPWQLAATHPHLLTEFSASIAANTPPLVWYTQFTGNEVLHRTERSSRLHFDRSRNAQQLREALTDHLELTAASGLRSVLSLTGTTDTATKGSARNLDRLVENARLSAVHLGASLPAGDRVSATNGELHGFKKLHVADVSALPSLPGVNPQASVMAFAKMYATEMFGEVSVS